MDINREILRISKDIFEDTVTWRRHLRMYPELSGQEYKTAEFVAKKLREFGVDEVIEGFAGSTAVVGIIEGSEKKEVALRADMDALAGEDRIEKPYASRVPGVAHLCGHDAHTAMLLGAAKALVEIKSYLKGSVKLIFQPCEERSECSGARFLIENGVLTPETKAIFGLHVSPELKTGAVGIKKGVVLASADFFNVRVEGKSAHASKPHKGRDPIVAACEMVSSIYHVVSRFIDPLEPAVISVGKIAGGYAENVIPDSVEFEGTYRALSGNVRKLIARKMEEIVKGLAVAYGVEASLTIKEGNPPLMNDDRLIELVKKISIDMFSKEGVVELERPSMGGEDFAFYLEKIPGVFIRLGTGNKEKGTTYPLHSSKFDIDEDALWVGTALYSAFAVSFLMSL